MSRRSDSGEGVSGPPRNHRIDRRQHAAGKRAFKNIRGWTQAVSKARKALGITGFCAVKKGTALYIKAREFYN